MQHNLSGLLLECWTLYLFLLDMSLQLNYARRSTDWYYSVFHQLLKPVSYSYYVYVFEPRSSLHRKPRNINHTVELFIFMGRNIL